MKYISMFVTVLVVGLGFIVLNADQASAGVPMPCNIVIEKVEEPDTGRLFDFEVEGNFAPNFSLGDGDSENVGLDIDETIEIIEDIPEGYTLEIECVEGSTNCGSDFFEPCLAIQELEDGTGVVVECLDDDEGSCTFTNTLAIEPAQVPTLSEWGLISMAGVLGIIGFMVIRRRKATA
ncbi:MAG: hypothetical protein DHS20C13_02380 [Thermodesulfobacteriota bacterium]|nr:MAG: hypothetical protein DHS20C13_02380 [Thermodesulfobacteriota bacterium]